MDYLPDRRWFILEYPSWEEFLDVLRRPAVIKPRLAELLSEKNGDELNG